MKVDDSASWAVGWAVQHGAHGDIIFHGGDERGVHSMAVASVPARSGFVIKTNGDNGKALVHRLMAEPRLEQVLPSSAGDGARSSR